MITVLSGGTGSPKLIEGLRRHLRDEEIAVVVNTAEDLWISGNHLSPDIDTVLYLFAGILNTGTWWGIDGDSFVTHEMAAALGEAESIAVGDRDRAVHIARGEMLRRGLSLTQATALLADRLGVAASVMPMTDSEVATFIATDDELIHFQDYWVKRRGDVEIRKVVRRYVEPPIATDEVVVAIETADGVIVGPSNPVTSIGPILECAGVEAALKKQYVVAVSPFIGDAPISGPAGALMKAWGKEPDSRGTWELYATFCDLFIQDVRDTVEVPGAVRLDTLMKDAGVSGKLAGDILAKVREAGA